MLLRSLLTNLGFFILLATQAQYVKLSGKVLNEKNEPLPGVSIKLSTGGGTTSGVDGSFLLKLLPGKKLQPG